MYNCICITHLMMARVNHTDKSSLWQRFSIFNRLDCGEPRMCLWNEVYDIVFMRCTLERCLWNKPKSQVKKWKFYWLLRRKWMSCWETCEQVSLVRLRSVLGTLAQGAWSARASWRSLCSLLWICSPDGGRRIARYSLSDSYETFQLE